MGVPIILKSEGPDADFNHARATYSDCVKQIMEDADKAIELLPLDYKKFADSEIPEKYKNIGVTNASDYRRVCGEEYRGLMSGCIGSPCTNGSVSCQSGIPKRVGNDLGTSCRLCC